MISHTVMWRLKDDLAGQCKNQTKLILKQKLEAMNGKIPGMISIEVGLDTRNRENSADVFLLCRFVDHDALEAYHSHPEHEALKPFVREIQLQSIVVDY